MSVVQFPLDRLADNIKRHLNAFFRDMAAKGYTQEQMFVHDESSPHAR